MGAGIWAGGTNVHFDSSSTEFLQGDVASNLGTSAHDCGRDKSFLLRSFKVLV